MNAATARGLYKLLRTTKAAVTIRMSDSTAGSQGPQYCLKWSTGQQADFAAVVWLRLKDILPGVVEEEADVLDHAKYVLWAPRRQNYSVTQIWQ